MDNHSYMICKRGETTAVCEIFNQELLKHLNTEKYYSITALEYLGRLNRSIVSSS